jgi:hypothetical protein
MKTIVQYILGASVLILFQNCKTSDDNDCCPPPYTLNHYIQMFKSDIKDINIIKAKGFLEVNEDQNMINIDKTQLGNYIIVTPIFNNYYRYISGKQDKEYLQYSELINDKHFPIVDSRGWEDGYATAIVDTLQSVKIFAKQDYITDFPAGSDVSSLFNIYFEAPLRTIQNNYQSVTAEDSYQDKRIGSFPHTITGNVLSKVNFSQNNFIGGQWLLMPNRKPDILGEYTFTIEITTNDGRVITKTTEPFMIN